MPEESRRVERLSHLVYGNNRRYFPDGRKGMQSPGEIKNVSGISGNQRRPKLTPWERNGWEVRRGGRKASHRTKERVHRFGQERRASRLPCLSVGFGDDRRSASRNGDVNLAIFITSVSGSESLVCFTNCTLHLSRPLDFRMVFDAAERNGKFVRIQHQRGKESSSRGKKKRQVFLCRRTVGVKVIPASFLKVEGRKKLVGAKE